MKNFADVTPKDKWRQNWDEAQSQSSVKYSHFEFPYFWCKHDKGLYNGVMSTITPRLSNILTCVKQKLRFKVALLCQHAELCANTSEISAFVWLRAFFWRRAGCRLTLHICLPRRGTSAVHLDNRKGYVSGFDEITFCEYHSRRRVGSRARGINKKGGVIGSWNISPVALTRAS